MGVMGTLDRHDLKTLGELHPTNWQFVAWKDAERCARLRSEGLLEEDLRMFSQKARIGPKGGVDIAHRQAFRLTDAGRARRGQASL